MGLLVSPMYLRRSKKSLAKIREFRLEIGQIVRSKAGRDKGQVLVVYDYFDESHVLVVDGKRRRLDSPKKKKEKHLQKSKRIIDKKEMVNDCRIRKIIQSFEKNEEDH